MYYHYFIFRFGYYSAGSQQRSTAEMNECINEYVSAWLASPPPLLPPPHSPTPPSTQLSSFRSCQCMKAAHTLQAEVISSIQYVTFLTRGTYVRDKGEKKKFEILIAKSMCSFSLPPTPPPSSVVLTYTTDIQ